MMNQPQTIALRLITVTVLLLLTCKVRAQDPKGYTLSFPPMPLAGALKKLAAETGIHIAFSSQLVSPYTIKDISTAKRTFESYLHLLLNGTSLTFKNAGGIYAVIPLDDHGPDSSLIATVSGRITDTAGNPVQGAAITIEGGHGGTYSERDGSFRLQYPGASKANLVVNSLGYLISKQPIRNDGWQLLIILHADTAMALGSVSVNTGYQVQNRERLTGSYAVADSGLLNRRVSPGLLSRLDGVVSSMLFTKNIRPGNPTNQSQYSVRGRSTINSNPQPLIVVDNFPYDGNPDNINPNDVESVTVLKDAAASSIWGAFSGNGVIVITTRKGRYNQDTKVSFNTNMTLAQKPDLFYTPVISSSDYVDMETYLFNQGYYSYTSNPYSLLSPVVEMLIKRKQGLISAADSASQVQGFRGTDVRNEISQYYYRPAFNQQYALNVSGGAENSRRFFSVGYDKSLSSLVRNSNDRLTFSASQTNMLLNKKIEATANLFFARSGINNPNQDFYPYRPYLRLKNGQNLSVPAQYRQSYKDTAGSGFLLDWSYRPLDDLANNQESSVLNEYRASFQLKYKVLKGLTASVNYQYSFGNYDFENYLSQQMFYTRNLINSYTQVNRLTGVVTRPVPPGGIQDITNASYSSHNVRSMLNYNAVFRSSHEVSAIAGYDVRIVNSKTRSYRIYGYDKSIENGAAADLSTQYPDYVTGALSRIPSNIYNQIANNNYLSWYFNGLYTYNSKYSVSLSLRRDESNLFGVDINQKGVPLWSAGLGWTVKRESYLQHVDWLSQLKLRTSLGYNGNVNTSLSAYTTATRSTTRNRYGAVIGTVSNPPNPRLRWEKVRTFNLGLDFGLFKDRITGSVEYYQKSGKDLIAPGPIDPTTGVSTYIGNAADMQARGLDLVLRSLNTTGKLKWNTDLLFSLNRDKVVTYKIKKTIIGEYMQETSLNPQENYPLYSVYSYRFLGLDHSGNPISMLEGQPSQAYSAIQGSTNFSNLNFHGSAVPTLFGTVRNTLSLGEWSCSFLVGYKGGYYFRRPSVNYSALFNGNDNGNADFALRWRQSGDELKTTVPALNYPADPQRDAVYTYSEILVEKGNHLRLQDFQLCYEFKRESSRHYPFESARVYMYINNIGILWRANKHHIDPDYVPYNTDRIMPEPRTYSLGINVNF